MKNRLIIGAFGDNPAELALDYTETLIFLVASIGTFELEKTDADTLKGHLLNVHTLSKMFIELTEEKIRKQDDELYNRREELKQVVDKFPKASEE